MGIHRAVKTMSEGRRRVAMIGLDAVDLDFVRGNLGSLPVLKRALDTGLIRRLRSTADDLAGSVWPTFYTGTLPGQHGLYHHLQWSAEQMQIRRVSEDWLYCEPFWHKLSRTGLRTIAIDVPMTFQPKATNGAEVISWGSHDALRPFASYPDDLGRTVRAKFGHHPMGNEFPLNKSEGVLDQIRRELVEGASKKGELACWLAREPWDFFITVFGECHRGGHLLWPSEGARPTALLEVYQAVDRALGSLLELMAPTADVFLFAVHGMGPNLCQEHLLTHVMDIVNERFAGASEISPAARRSRSLIPWLRERLPPGIQNAIARRVPVGVRDGVMNHSVIDGHDWARDAGAGGARGPQRIRALQHPRPREAGHARPGFGPTASLSGPSHSLSQYLPIARRSTARPGCDRSPVGASRRSLPSLAGSDHQVDARAACCGSPVRRAAECPGGTDHQSRGQPPARRLLHRVAAGN